MKCSHHKRKKQNTKRHKETLRDVEHVYYLDFGDGVMVVGLCPNSRICIHQIYAVLCFINCTLIKLLLKGYKGFIYPNDLVIFLLLVSYFVSGQINEFIFKYSCFKGNVIFHLIFPLLFILLT